MIYFNIFNHFIKGDCLCLEYLVEKGICSICGKEKTSKKLNDGFVCSKCLDLCGNNRNTFKKLQETTKNEILEEIEKKNKQT